MTINSWLETFCKNWQHKDIEGLLALFDESVEYWETPHKKLDSFEQLRAEWLAILSMSKIALTTTVFGSDQGRHAVRWRLTYNNEQDEQQSWAGVYLIALNDDGLCTYFHQTGEHP